MLLLVQTFWLMPYLQLPDNPSPNSVTALPCTVEKTAYQKEGKTSTAKLHWKTAWYTSMKSAQCQLL